MHKNCEIICYWVYINLGVVTPRFLSAYLLIVIYGSLLMNGTLKLASLLKTSSLFFLLTITLISSHSYSDEFSFSEYEYLGLSSFRNLITSSLENYDPYSGKVRFHHQDVSVISSGSLTVDISRNSTMDITSRIYQSTPGWQLWFGGFISTSPKQSDESICASVQGETFVTKEGFAKALYRTGSNTAFGSAASRASKDGWRLSCLQSSSNSSETAVVTSPDGTKYYVGTYFNYSQHHVEYLVTKVESPSGDWYSINYSMSEKRFSSSTSNKKKYLSISSIYLSNGDEIEFNYAVHHLDRRRTREYLISYLR